jgi:transposase
MLYAGIDVHRRNSYISVIDAKGNRVVQRNLPSEIEAISVFLGGLAEVPCVVMESTSAWYWLYDGLTERGYSVVVSDPRKTKAIASARIKNDKLDAHMLAQLLRADLVATVYVSPLEYRELKELLRHRVRLVRDKRRMKNRIHNLLAKNNIKLAVKDVFSRKGREFLRAAALPSCHRRPVDSYLALLDQLEVQISQLDLEVKERAQADPQAQLLMSLPGVGPVVAMTFLAEVGDIRRFKTHRQLAAYVGLIPCLDSSAGKNRLGHISKQGSAWLRSALVESAQVVANLKGRRLNLYFRKRITKAGYKKAVVATAHRLLQFAFYVLRDQRPYQEQLEIAA